MMRNVLAALLLGIVLGMLGTPAHAHGGGQSPWDGSQAEFLAGHDTAG